MDLREVLVVNITSRTEPVQDPKRRFQVVRKLRYTTRRGGCRSREEKCQAMDHRTGPTAEHILVGCLVMSITLAFTGQPVQYIADRECGHILDEYE